MSLETTSLLINPKSLQIKVRVGMPSFFCPFCCSPKTFASSLFSAWEANKADLVNILKKHKKARLVKEKEDRKRAAEREKAKASEEREPDSS